MLKQVAMADFKFASVMILAVGEGGGLRRGGGEGFGGELVGQVPLSVHRTGGGLDSGDAEEFVAAFPDGGGVCVGGGARTFASVTLAFWNLFVVTSAAQPMVEPP